MKKTFTLLFTLISLQLFSQSSFVVCRVGDGTAALSSAATPVFLEQYNMAGNLQTIIPMPTTVSGSNHILTLSGTATSEGLITRSEDMRYIMIAGYNAAVGTTAISTSTGSTINRVIGRIDYNGNIDATTALTNLASGANPRSASSSDGVGLWATGGAGGVIYTTIGSTSSVSILANPANLREVNIFNGQLYASTGSGSFRLLTVGTGLPTMAGQIVTELNGIPTTSGSPYGYFFADLSSSVPGLDVVYIADDVSGIVKYSFDGTTWQSNGSIAGNVRGLAGFVTDTLVTLLATTTQTNANSVITLTDSSGYSGTLATTPTTLITAGANTVYRGIALAPVGPASVSSVSTSAGFTIYPNPSKDDFKIDCGIQSFDLRIYDMTGRLVYSDLTGKPKYEIKHFFFPGVYLVKLQMEGSLMTQKLIVD